MAIFRAVSCEAITDRNFRMGTVPALLQRALLILTACIAMAASADEPEGLLLIEVAGLTEAQGSIFVAVYDSKKEWLGDGAIETKEVVIQEALKGEFVVTEMVLPIGEYALTVFYDRNDNGELDTNFIGIPKEPIALSNNAKAKFGPPKYDDARFELQLEPVTQRINMTEIK